jgi:hypothetical protein
MAAGGAPEIKTFRTGGANKTDQKVQGRRPTFDKELPELA